MKLEYEGVTIRTHHDAEQQMLTIQITQNDLWIDTIVVDLQKNKNNVEENPRTDSSTG
jgi:hypothetical protein